MHTEHEDNTISYKELIIFFIPIALSTMIMMTSHTIINSAMARTVNAAAAIAGYAVAKSVFNMIQSPTMSIRRMFMTMYQDRTIYQRANKVGAIIVAFSTITMLILLVTPLGRYVLVDIMGLDAALVPGAIQTLMVFAIMPILSMTRSVYQALITLQRKTYLLTLSTIFRIAIMLVLAFTIVQTGFIKGSVVGAVILTTGMASETLFVYVTGRKLKHQLPEQSKQSQSMTTDKIWWFFIPLVAAQFIHSFSQPGINAGLARTINPEVALAAYSVAYSFALIFIVMFTRMHQLVLVFVKNKRDWVKVRRFSVCLGVMNSVVLLTIALTPLGEWVMQYLIGVDAQLTAMVLKSVAVLAIAPLILSLNESYVGVLMACNRTKGITMSKVISVSSLLFAVLVLGRFFPQLEVVMGSLSLVVSYLAEFMVLYVFTRGTTIMQGEYQEISQAMVAS